MGSLEAACISGFLCRLCSEMHRMVIHIYGDQGEKHRLAEKINGYLPVTITPNDPLPKTICKACMTRVEQHHELMLKMAKHRSFFAAQSGGARIIRPENLLAQRRTDSNPVNAQATYTNRTDRHIISNEERLTAFMHSRRINNNNSLTNNNRNNNSSIAGILASISNSDSNVNENRNNNDDENDNNDNISNNSNSNASTVVCIDSSNSSNTDSNIISMNFGNNIVANVENDNASV